MSLFFSKSMHGFIDSSLFSGVMPSDAVSVSADAHSALMAAQAAGKVIVGDANGNPIASDPAGPSQADLNTATRARLAIIDLISIRAIREWLVQQPTCPQFTKDHEAAAAAERAKLA